MKEKSCEHALARGPRNGSEPSALTVGGGERPLSAWWAVPGMDGLTMMRAMVEVNRTFFNCLFAYAGTRLRSDSIVRNAVFGTRWPGIS